MDYDDLYRLRMRARYFSAAAAGSTDVTPLSELSKDYAFATARSIEHAADTIERLQAQLGEQS